MRIKTLEGKFTRQGDIKVYAINSNKTRFTTGHIEKLERNDGVLKATLHPYVEFSTMKGFLTGHKLQGPCDESLIIELEEDPFYTTRYNNLTFSFDTHKRRTDKIIYQEMEGMMESKKERYKQNYLAYFEIAKKLP